MESILRREKFFKPILIFLSFSIFFSFNLNFNSKKVYSNPLIGVAESEVVSVVVNILSAFGVVVSIPTARDFLEQEKDFANQKALELQNHQGAVTKGLQALKEGYYVSKEFIQEVLSKWEDYRIKNNIDSTTVNNYVSLTFPSAYDFYHESRLPSVTIDNYYTKCLKSFSPYIPSSASKYYVYLCYNGTFSNSPDSRVLHTQCPEDFGKNLSFTYQDGNLMLFGQPDIINLFRGFSGIKVEIGEYVTKPKIDKKVIDNVLDPVNSQSQGMVISPQQVESVGKVLDPSIPDVPSSSIVNNAPISSVASTYPNVVTGADVGALPWGDVGSIDKPTDIPKDESKDIPKDESKDTPKDESKDTPKDEEGVDFTPLLALGGQLKEIFPFCVPFDLVHQLNVFKAPSKVPIFEFNLGDTQFFKRNSIDYTIKIDFSRFEVLAAIIRFFIQFLWIVFLCIKTRPLIRG